MMVTVLSSTRGRITLPKVVRNSLGLKPGDRVAIEIHGTSEILLKPLTKPVEEVYGKLAGPEISKKSVADMNRIVADRMNNRHQ